jgi:predicted deacylase
MYSSILEVPAAPGRYLARIPVTTDMNGFDVTIAAHVLVGSKPGPTLTLLSGLHGNEWLHLEFFRQFVAEFNPEQTAGRVLVVPMANAVAFGTLSRYVRDDSDNADANRSFPVGGRAFTWLAEQVATCVATEVFAHTNALIDFHLGIWGSVMCSTNFSSDYSNPEVSAESEAMAFAFGSPWIFASKDRSGWPGPRTSQGYAGEMLGIPSCCSFIGGAGFDHDLEHEWANRNLTGIRNVMKHMGMLTGEQDLPARYLVYDAVHRVNPKCGGLLEPVNLVETFGRTVKAGEVLGRIISPFSFETIEELVSPVDGVLSFWARNYPIRPGEWAYGVVPIDHPGTRFVERP